MNGIIVLKKIFVNDGIVFDKLNCIKFKDYNYAIISTMKIYMHIYSITQKDLASIFNMDAKNLSKSFNKNRCVPASRVHIFIKHMGINPTSFYNNVEQINCINKDTKFIYLDIQSSINMI